MSKRKIVKMILPVFLVVSLMFSTVTVFAVDIGSEQSSVPLLSGVTQQMCSSDYWKNKASYGADTVLMTKDEVKDFNKRAFESNETKMYDLENLEPTYNALQLKEKLVSEVKLSEKVYYIDGKKLEGKEIIALQNKISSAISNTGYNEKNKEVTYAVATNRALITLYPVSSFVGYSEDDTDNEFAASAVNLNEPFVIEQYCKLEQADGNIEEFYWGYALNYSGWINAKDLAIVNSKSEWLDSWKVDVSGNDFIVVTEDKFQLEPSVYTEYENDILINMGTILKLVPENEVPEQGGERSSFYNYVVYIPTRNSEGKYEQKIAFIPLHHKVNIGFVDMTQANILDIAFEKLGNRYGWGSMLGCEDCSSYVCLIYRCFGIMYPRDTYEQVSVPGSCIHVKDMTDDEKIELFSKLPAGSSLYMDGHTMMFIGTENKMNYAINAMGSIINYGDTEMKTVMNVAIMPLLSKSTSGKTWIQNIDDVVVPWGIKDFKENGWKQNDFNQWLYYENGVAVTGWKNNIPGWNGKWFHFGSDGIMNTGWLFDNGKWYYLNPNGTMATGWIYLDAWYCLADNGAMYQNTITPDGYPVDENGRWI